MINVHFKRAKLALALLGLVIVTHAFSLNNRGYIYDVDKFKDRKLIRQFDIYDIYHLSKDKHENLLALNQNEFTIDLVLGSKPVIFKKIYGQYIYIFYLLYFLLFLLFLNSITIKRE
jgi:hypothetical protein